MKTSKTNPIFVDGSATIKVEGGREINKKSLKNLDMLFQVMLSVLSSWAFVHLFTSAFGLTVNELVFLPVILISSFLVSLVIRGKKLGIVFLGVYLAVGIGYLILNWKGVISECAGIYEKVTGIFSERYGFAAAASLNTESDYSATFVMCCVAFLPIWQAAYSYGRKMYPVLMAVFMLLPVYVDFAAGQGPSLLSVALMLISLISLFLACRADFINRDLEVEKFSDKKLRLQVALSTLLATTGLVLISAFVLFPVFSSGIEKLQSVYSSHFFSDLFADIENNPFNLSKNGLNNGDLASSGNVVRNGDPLFTVSIDGEVKNVIYLRGYAGDLYTGDQWTNDHEELPEECVPETVAFKDTYRSGVNAVHPFYRNPFLFYGAINMQRFYHPESENVKLTIYKRGGDEYAYFPYFVNDKVQNMDEQYPFAFKKDLYLKGSDENDIQFSFYNYPYLSDVLKLAKGDNSSQSVNPDGSHVVHYLEDKDLFELLKNGYGAEITVGEIRQNPYNEYVLRSGDGSEIYYRLQDPSIAAYENYVKENCLAFEENDKIRQVADEIAKTYNLDTAVPDYERTVRAVQAYLASHEKYSIAPGSTSRNKDFVEDFLFEKKQGYCVHFAAAGTLLLRYLGVPARYVEGYLVPASKAGQTVEITDYEAHAWSEVFVQGFGWYPVEMTPKTEEDPDETTELPPEESTPEVFPDETTIETTDPETDPSTSSDETDTDDSTVTETDPSMSEESESEEAGPDVIKEENDYGWLLVLILVLLAAGGIGVFLYIRNRIIPLEKIKGENARERYLNLYALIQKQAHRAGVEISIDDPFEEIHQTYKNIPLSDLKQMQEDAKEVYYSKNELSEESMNFLYRLYEEKAFVKVPKEN